jgi:hypothetical protein
LPDIGLRAQKTSGRKMDLFLMMQTVYNIAETRTREGKINVKRNVAAKLRLPKQPPLSS